MVDTIHAEPPAPEGPGLPDREAETTLCRIQSFLARRWPSLVLSTLLVLLATGVLLRMAPSHYTAHAEILLDPRREKLFGSDDPSRTVALDTADVESAILALSANATLSRVVEATDLAADVDFYGGAQPTPSVWSRLVSVIRGIGPPPALPAADQARAALARSLRVERVGKSYVLSVRVTTRRPALSARLANAVTDAFVEQERDAHLEAARRAAAFFAERLGPLGDHLRQSEAALEGFRRGHDLIAQSASAQGAAESATIAEQQLGELNSRLAAARAETAQAWARYDQARTLEARGGPIEGVPDIVRSTLIGQLREQQAVVARKGADLAARYNDDYPALVNARAEKREIDRAIAREMARILANLKGTYEIAQSQEDALRASVATTTGAAGLDSDLGPRLRELERVKLVDQTVFETYLAKAKAAEQQSTFEEHDVRVISAAEPPFMPTFPRASLVFACMGLFGLGLGTALGFALDTLDPGFRTPRHTESALGVRVLAAVPWLTARERTVDGQLVDPPRTLASHPHSRFAEAMHAIRAGIRMSEGLPAKVVLVTSAMPAEGKSMIALSLAVSAARAGQRVLLVDADLRSPALSRSLGFQDRLGLVDMLAGVVGTRETTVALGASLAMMPSGRKSAAAPDLFASARMERYLDHLRAVYDLVVIDAAPSGVVVDARVLADLSDRIVFVVGWRATARDLVARNLRVLGHPRKLAGVVLNKIDERRALPFAAGVAAAAFGQQRGARA